jgi:Periplasmic copper-binding protein CueP
LILGGNAMKSLLLSFLFLLGMVHVNTAHAQEDFRSAEKALDNVDAIQAVAIANEWKWSKGDIKSYVDSREVVFKFPNGKVKRIPLPKDKMLVAVAPYINQTHTWSIHFMSSCQGELAEKTFEVKAVDQHGKVLVDGTISTLRNGFFELWLPRERRIELSIRGMNRTAKGFIGTFDGSNTCITTIQLKWV